jgi:hypothetical protein
MLLEMDWAIANIIIKDSKELPPYDNRGSVSPVIGTNPIFIPMLIPTWKAIIIVKLMQK